MQKKVSELDAITTLAAGDLVDISQDAGAGSYTSKKITIDNVKLAIDKVGTIGTGTWQGSVIGASYGGAGTINGILKADGSGTVSAAVAGTNYEVPLTFSTGLTRSTNTVTVNTTQNIAKLSNLTSNGFVKTSGGDGTLSVDTTVYNSGTGTSGQITYYSGTNTTTSSGKFLVELSGNPSRMTLHAQTSGYSAIDGYGYANGYGLIISGKASNGTQASPTLCSAGDYLFIIQGLGYNGSAYNGGASIQFRQRGGTPSSTSMPTSMFFYTTNVGSTSQSIRGSIDFAGRWGIGGISDPNTTSSLEIGVVSTYHLIMSNGASLGRFRQTPDNLEIGISGATTPLIDLISPARITTSSASRISLVVKGAASQSSNLQEWQNSSSTVLTSVNSSGDIVFNATNIQSDTTTGTKIGTSASQKFSLWNAPPVAQPTTAVGSATLNSPGAGSQIKSDDTFDGYTLQQVVAALRLVGILA